MSKSSDSHSASNKVRKEARAVITGTRFHLAYAGVAVLWTIVVVAYAALQFLSDQLGTICGGKADMARAAFAALTLLACLATFLFASETRIRPSACREKLGRLCEDSVDVETVQEEIDRAGASSGVKLALGVAMLLSAVALAMYPVLFKSAGITMEGGTPYAQLGEICLFVLSAVTMLSLVFIVAKSERAASAADAMEQLGHCPSPALQHSDVQHTSEKSLLIP
ncbi:hypothetical protein ACJZTR_00335 [Neorickettsia risticii]